MWQSKEEEEKQRQLEKLIDWETSKMLSWVVLVLTFLLGAIQLLGSRLVKSSEVLSFKSTFLTIETHANLPFVVIYGLMIIGLDLSFYRLTATFVRLHDWYGMLPEFMRKPLVEEYPLKLFFQIFETKTAEKRLSLRLERVLLLIILGDLLLIWALVSV